MVHRLARVQGQIRLAEREFVAGLHKLTFLMPLLIATREIAEGNRALNVKRHF